MKELPGGGPEPKPLHNAENIADHVRALQEQADFSGKAQPSESFENRKRWALDVKFQGRILTIAFRPEYLQKSTPEQIIKGLVDIRRTIQIAEQLWSQDQDEEDLK